METGDYIQMGILVVTIFTLAFTLLSYQKQQKLQMYAEYTRRYEYIFMNMPDDVYGGTAAIDDKTIKYLHLYFNLCSEEYHLWKDRHVENKVWQLWVEGMQIETRQEIFRNTWNIIKKEYNQDFRDYFETNVINHKNEEK